MQFEKSQRGKPHGSLGRMLPLLVLALVIAGIVYLILKPEIFINLMRQAQSQSQGTTLTTPSAESSPSATASESPGTKTPADYVALISKDLKTLSDQEKSIVNIFNDELDKISKMKTTETSDVNGTVGLIFQPLSVAKTNDDLDKVRSAAEKVKQSAENAATFFQQVQTDVAKRLGDVGLAAPLDTQVAEAFANQGSVASELKTAQDTSKFADATIAYVDFLKESHDSWTRKADGSLSFKDKQTLTKAQQLGKAYTDSAIQAGFQMTSASGQKTP